MDKKKYKYLIIALIVLVIIIDIVLFYFAFLKKDTLKMKEYKNTDYSFQYRSDYEVKEISKEKISLGSNNKTLEQNDLQKFKERFIEHIKNNNLDILE